MPQAWTALAESARRCEEMLRSALLSAGIKGFRRDGWARAWPAGAAMVVYMISHEAHHRGRVSMLAHQFGAPLPRKWRRALELGKALERMRLHSPALGVGPLR